MIQAKQLTKGMLFSATGGGVALGICKLRQRAPMISAMRLLPEYFPEELCGASTKRWVCSVLCLITHYSSLVQASRVHAGLRKCYSDVLAKKWSHTGREDWGAAVFDCVQHFMTSTQLSQSLHTQGTQAARGVLEERGEEAARSDG